MQPMKRITPILCFLFLIPLVTLSQDTLPAGATSKKKKSALELVPGYVVTLGDYAQTDPNSEKTGYAANGLQIQFTYDWMGTHDLGLAIQYTFQKNSLKTEAESVYPEGVHDSTYFLGPGAWTNNYLMIGPVYMKYFGRILLDVRVMAGGLVSSGRTFSTTNPSTRDNNSNTATGFAFQCAAGVGYRISDHFTLKVQLAYLAAWPVKKRQYGSELTGYEEHFDPNTGTYIQTPVYSAPAEYIIKRTISVFSPGIGLLFKF